MPDLKRVVAGAIDATKNIKSVYEKLVDLGDGTYAKAVALTSDSMVNASLRGSPIVASGKKTDADSTNKTISTSGFNYVSIINDGPAELRIGIDESSLTGSKIIYIGDAEVFEGYISGTAINYSITNDSCTFRYLLK